MALAFLKQFVGKFAGKPVDWDALEEVLIRSDLGVPLSLEILGNLQNRPSPPTAEAAEEAIRQSLLELFAQTGPPLHPLPTRPKVILMLGVNGTGKTTSTAKLAHYLTKNRHSVMMAAADTFRAAAIEQLQHWGERLGVEVVQGQYQGDPAALCYDAYASAHRKNVEFLLCDTAGRLHTKSNLMQELSKICRTLGKHHPACPDEKWLVIDATTGTNALAQAKEFHQAVGLTGVVLTKVDGSGKGGIAAAIQKEFGVAPRFLGTGEQADDFQPFNRDVFVNRIL